MKIIVHGASGRMGHIVCEKIENRQADAIAARVAFDLPTDPQAGTYTALSDYTGEADLVIDFSNHAATGDLIAYCSERKLPVVLCTTGQTAEERAIIDAAAAEIPVFFAANMSIGIAVLCDLAARAAKMFPDADIEIVEAHHNQKLDVPSGTALMIANAIGQERPDAEFLVGRHENGKRTKQEIGVHSIRIGNEVGMHEVLISTGNETLTLKHEAESRSLFADGALAAADFLYGKPAGMYNMRDIIG